MEKLFLKDYCERLWHLFIISFINLLESERSINTMKLVELGEVEKQYLQTKQ